MRGVITTERFHKVLQLVRDSISDHVLYPFGHVHTYFVLLLDSIVEAR